MKRFVAVLNDMSYINTPADRMEVRDNMLWAWDGSQLVAMVDISAVICANVSERGNQDGPTKN